MAEPPGEAASSDSGRGDVLKDSLFSEIRRMATYFWASPERNKLVALCVGLIAVTAATAYAQIRLNAWNRPFYDALTRKDFRGFLEQLAVFAGLAAILLCLNVAQMWLNQMSRLVLRQGLVHDLLNEWLKPRRAFRLSNSGWMGVNPDQRLQADAQHLTELITDLGIGLLQATLLLLSFIGVLWVLSQHMVLPFAGHMLYVPGYMVWCALLYAGTASFLSWRVGRPLVALDAEHYAREADLRYALVRVNEEIEGISIYGGEADEKEHLNGVFETVLEVLRRIVGAMTRLTWVTAGYGWFTIVAPILVAAPSYLYSRMSFGELMMAVGAFNQVQSSLRFFVDNFSNIADWRATLLRVASFRSVVMTMDTLGDTESRIHLEESETHSIRLDDLGVATKEGCVELSEKHIELQPGARVLVVSASGGARDLLFRAIIGLWPWGRGRVSLPPRESTVFLPARAYVPPAMLRTALSYPHSAHTYDPAAISQALKDVGLERLLPLLDTTQRWDRRLNDDEKQCLAFARVILQRPQWVVMNGGFDVLDPVSRTRIEAVFSGQLKQVGVLEIGQDKAEDTFFTRRLRMITDPQGPTFRPAAPQVVAAT
jgi:vitamin B12/bleomycin/antimicrobial peptide transport system ATP-binding/permease protein